MIRRASMQDVDTLTALTLELWPHHIDCEMKDELSQLLGKKDAAFFLAYSESAAVGFAQCQLRHDYVEGTESSPVGYLEGIYVQRDHRGQGIARKLLAACENWAKTQGCREFASDCELTNTDSLRFHLKVGFAEANRIICFTKKLEY